MKFTLNCAADLYQAKVNLELAFPAFPSLADLHRQVETAFSIESSVLRPPGAPFVAFKLSRFQMFDERLGQWVDLISSSQLYEGAQLYAFQPSSERSEQQKQIPPARAPSAQTRASPLAPAASPPPAHRAISPPRINSSAILTSSPAPVVSAYERSVVMTQSVSSPVTAASRFSDVATVDAKARIVFDEIDANRNRLLEIEEFRRTFKLLNLEFSAATVNDLFNRGDADRDGTISISEWQQFAQYYPTLLDSLYFRSKEHYEEQRRRGVLANQQHAAEDSRSKERQTSTALDEARRDLATQEKNLNLAEQDLQAKLLKERDCRALLGDAKKDSERASANRNDRDRDVAAGRDRERQRHASVLEAQRHVETTEKRLAAQENDVSRAQEKERQLEALLAEARRETERQMKALQHVASELAATRDREQQALSVFADAQHEVHRLQDALAQAELELARRLEKERESEAVLGETQRDAARASHRRDEEERELQLQRERELHHQRLHQEALRAIEEGERAIRQLEKDLADYLARRQQLEAQENELIEQEVRLREQRFNLEEREGKFKSQTQTFTMTAGRFAVGAHGESSYRSPARSL